MQLVIVESPAKAKTIEKYLGKDFKVLASYGHVRDLPPKDGSVRPDEGFAMDWELYRDKQKRFKEISDAAKGADRLVLATDPDREGEAMLNFRGHNYGQASLLPIEGKQQNGGVLVPTRPLSAFTHAARHHDGTILKIDVEGAEEVVLNPILAQGKTGGWLPDAILIEVRHADQWDGDLCAEILAAGYRQTLRAEGNALYIRKT